VLIILFGLVNAIAENIVTTEKYNKMKISVSVLFALVGAVAVEGFSPSLSSKGSSSGSAINAKVATKADVAVEKPTGTSFLPEETIERAKSGSPVEKVKLEKDGTSGEETEGAIKMVLM